MESITTDCRVCGAAFSYVRRGHPRTLCSDPCRRTNHARESRASRASLRARREAREASFDAAVQARALTLLAAAAGLTR